MLHPVGHLTPSPCPPLLPACCTQVPNVTNTNKTAVVSVSGHSSSVTASVTRIDSTHANAYQAWLGMGSPTYPTRAQLALLHTASQLASEPIAPSSTSGGGGGGTVTHTYSIELEASGVALLEVFL